MTDAANGSAPSDPSVSTGAPRLLAIGYASEELASGMAAASARLDRCRRAAARAGYEIPENLEFVDVIVEGVRQSRGRRRMWAAIRKYDIKHVFCCERNLTFERCRRVQALMEKAGVTVHWLGDLFDHWAAELDEDRREFQVDA